ncbi:MAG: hypothetical protein ACLR7Y_09360 [Dysosmobacter sp.]|jgi:hypothetical protein
MTADLLCLSEQKISMKTARETVPFCIAAAEAGGFFHEQIGGDFIQQADFSCSVPLRR